jgi:hypothetical protein
MSRMRDGDETNLLPSLAPYIKSQLSSVMTVAGYQDAEQKARTLTEEFESGLQIIANSVVELRETIAKMASCDIDVLFSSRGTSFDARWMSDYFESNRKASEVPRDELVLCTTSLGLKLTRNVTRSRDAGYENVLLKAKVVFQSVMSDLIVVEWP